MQELRAEGLRDCTRGARYDNARHERAPHAPPHAHCCPGLNAVGIALCPPCPLVAPFVDAILTIALVGVGTGAEGPEGALLGAVTPNYD